MTRRPTPIEMKVTRALAGFDGEPEEVWQQARKSNMFGEWLNEARVAIRAMRQPDVNMLKAGMGAYTAKASLNVDLRHIYNAMIDAASPVGFIPPSEHGDGIETQDDRRVGAPLGNNSPYPNRRKTDLKT